MPKIRLAVIWENIDQRPELFDGLVLLTDKDGNVLPTVEVVPEERKEALAEPVFIRQTQETAAVFNLRNE